MMLKKELPSNVNLLTLDQRLDGKYLLRIEHPYDSGEDARLSRPVTISLRKVSMVYIIIIFSLILDLTSFLQHQSLFNGFSITSAEETMLGGNQFKKDSKRLVWKESNKTQEKNLISPNSDVDIENVTLNPMQIRTFILYLERK